MCVGWQVNNLLVKSGYNGLRQGSSEPCLFIGGRIAVSEIIVGEHIIVAGYEVLDSMFII